MFAHRTAATMQQRSSTDRRRGAEREAAQPLGGQPRSEAGDEDLQEPEFVPSFLSAREFEYGQDRRIGERRGKPVSPSGNEEE